MLFHSSQFWYTLTLLGCTAVYSIFLGGLAKTSFVKALRSILGLIATAILVWSVINCVRLIHMPFGFVVTILGIFWSGVFFLGAMVVVNQDLTTKNGSVHIKEGSILYWYLTKFCGLDPDKPRTLCSISWLGMIAIIAWPLLICFGTVVVTVVSTVVFLLSGRNPISNAKEFIKDADHFSVKIVKWGPVPMIPLMWAGIGGLIWLLVWLTKFSLVVNIYRIAGIAMASLVVFLIIAKIYDMIVPQKPDHNPDLYGGPGVWGRAYDGALAPTGRAIKTGTITPFVMLFQVIMTIKKRFCPPIVIDRANA